MLQTHPAEPSRTRVGLALTAALVSLALVATGLAVHAVAGPGVLTLALAAGAVAVRPVAARLHRRREGRRSIGYQPRG